jgi:hypothetical protein
MTQHLTRKRALLAAGVLTLAIATVAFAFWSTTGSGTGSAATGSADANGFTVTAGDAPTGIAPGAAAHSLTATIANNSGEAYQLGSVTVTISNVTNSDNSAIDPAGACEADDYRLVDNDSGDSKTWNAAAGTSATLTVGQSLANGGSYNLSGVGIEFNNSASEDQNGCQGKKVHLTYAAA